MKDKQKLLTFLQSQRLMTLATCSDKPHTSSVYYGISDNFMLYFISEKTTQHCRDIVSNPHVAVAITDSRQVVTDKKVGAQVTGIVSEVKEILELKKALSLWTKNNPGLENIINLKAIQEKLIKGRFYKVTPTEIKFFNEKLYDSEGFEVFEID